MAQIKTTGLEDVERELERLGSDFSEAADAVLTAEAAVYVQEWQREILQRGHKRTGSMHDNVRMNSPRDYQGGRVINVYPQGTDDKGVANAVKAYVTHYGKGRRKGKTGDKFVAAAEKKAENKALEAGRAAFAAWAQKG